MQPKKKVDGQIGMKKRKTDDETTFTKETVEQTQKKARTDSNSIASLPRITTSVTLAQLSHEIHYRDPSVKGISNKNKHWFLDHLGVETVWTSAPSAKDVDSTSIPKVSSSMTIAQMSHEMLERNPTQSGMSGKNKVRYLERLGIGSILITGLSSTGAAGLEDPAKRKASEKATASSNSSTKV